jgi:hemoglobin
MGKHDMVNEATIAELVEKFYARARKDPEIGPVFEAGVHDWSAHLATLNDFWSSVMLTSGRYKGNPMAAHMKHPLRPDFFTRWLALWGETADELFVPEEAARFRHKAERIAESLKLGLFYRPEGLRIVAARR